MNSKDILMLNAYALKPLLPCIFTILGVTVLAVTILLIRGKGVWFGKPNFVLSLFIEMRATLAIKFACAWIKCVTICFFVLSFTKLQAVHYIFFAVPCVCVIIISSSIAEVATHIVSILIQFVGLFATNILCSYIIQFELKLSYIFMYILVALIIALYSVYIFISEIDFISMRRSVKIENFRRFIPKNISSTNRLPSEDAEEIRNVTGEETGFEEITIE